MKQVQDRTCRPSSSALKQRELMLLDKLEVAQSECPELVESIQAEVTETQQARLEAIRRERADKGLSVFGGRRHGV